MFVEIKVIEEHFNCNDNNNTVIEEVPNSSKTLGSEQIKKLGNKFNLISSSTYHYPCRKFNNVTVFVTTYIFSDKKTVSL